MILSKISIGPMKYQLKFVEEITLGDEECDGLIDKVNEVILINRDLPEGRFKAMVIFHEVIHGFLETLGLDEEEALVNAVTYGLLDLFQKNPDLFKYIIRTFSDEVVGYDTAVAARDSRGLPPAPFITDPFGVVGQPGSSACYPSTQGTRTPSGQSSTERDFIGPYDNFKEASPSLNRYSLDRSKD